jgi:kinesin family protein C1
MEGFSEREDELYRKLRESDRIRRDLHSRVMQLMGNIRVYVRVRPPIPGELEQEADRVAEQQDADSKKRKRDDNPSEEPFRYPGIYDRGDKKAASSHGADDLTKNIIEVTEPHKDRGGLSDRRKKWRFGFDNVFSPDHGQDDVWEATEPLVQSAVDGYDVTIFAYGQTGSGTYCNCQLFSVWRQFATLPTLDTLFCAAPLSHTINYHYLCRKNLHHARGKGK